MGSGFSKMKKQQKLMQQKMAEMQEEMSRKEHEGSAGGGLVKVVLSGDKNLKSISIQKECVDPDDIEGLQDLIYGAFQEACSKIEEGMQDSPMNLFPGM